MSRPSPPDRRRPGRSPRRWPRWAFAGLALALVLALTLGTGHGDDAAAAETTGFWCVLCGSFGTADFLLNIALFVPLGVALRRVGLPAPIVVLGALALSGLIEGLQLAMPGRFSVAGDLVANTVGALVGASAAGAGALSLHRRTWTRHLVAVTAVAIAWLITAVSFLPSLPRSSYYGQWTPELGQYAAYRGSVLQATVGGRHAPGHRLDDSPGVRTTILAGQPVTVTFAAGPAPDRTAPIFSIFDDSQREILLIGANGDDIVVHLRRRAADLGLHGPTLRWPRALADVAPGDTLTVAVWREEGSRVCVAVATERRCHVPGVARGWSLLLGQERSPSPRADAAADLGWLALSGGAALAAAPGLAAVAGGAGVLAGVLVLAELVILR